MSEKLLNVVNKQVADWTVLYVKLHNYHWYVKGKDFFTLHEKFEELYTETATYIDDLAERMLALNGQPVATMKECLEISSIQEAEGNESAEQMVKNLYDDFSNIAEELKRGMELAAEVGDETTGDMLLAIHQSIEKHNWMLKAYLG
ncbi:DNA starvation/stationary phase protection protein [Bacillus altitudinis MN12]|jgi:starvation-inducible DNA-binding protein|uniref:Dps family protein n=2 Tax=Bacillus TaxID=1386 RepID=A0AB39IVQ9_9BACI|nr:MULTISPECIES: Dps family protein [Bacillus]EMI12709.1 dna-protecting ferritin [Bacillus stratosphericus LAMA 585]KML04340.1 general stress protein [Bacillus stratosphericus]KQL40764.1 general stress protein [Bacillus sp. FJAT-21955]MBW3702575.1 DNA starvation/stationary phase protection protein [Bacillus aerophilus]MDH8711499.1 starvation-inducible DNA-binding protein [Micromonospora sp. 1209]CVM43398.1 Dpr [Streptococcus pneumoniae]BAT49915.1 general stress protein [Bacillus pumilus]